MAIIRAKIGLWKNDVHNDSIEFGDKGSNNSNTLIQLLSDNNYTNTNKSCRLLITTEIIWTTALKKAARIFQCTSYYYYYNYQ